MSEPYLPISVDSVSLCVHNGSMSARVVTAAKFNGPVARLIREERGISQQVEADAVHIDRAHLSRIEKGTKQPSRDVVRKIASFLQLPISALLIDPNGGEGLAS
jgi:DNA-binding XRE family transcriptional regulator